MSGDNHNQADAPFEAHLYPWTLSTPHLIVKVMENHSVRGMTCRCGAQIGDSVDRVWHHANQITEALQYTGRIRGQVSS